MPRFRKRDERAHEVPGNLKPVGVATHLKALNVSSTASKGPAPISLSSHLAEFKQQDIFDFKRHSIVNILQMDKDERRYVALATKLFQISEEDAARDYKELLGRHFTHAARELYANRPKDEDAIKFYARVWGDLLSSGRAFREDIDRDDPALLDGVLNRCKYIARMEGGAPSAYYPPNFPPLHRPSGAPTARVEKARESNRRRQANFRNRNKAFHPISNG